VISVGTVAGNRVGDVEATMLFFGVRAQNNRRLKDVLVSTALHRAECETLKKAGGAEQYLDARRNNGSTSFR
jgi:hypothetical protein